MSAAVELDSRARLSGAIRLDHRTRVLDGGRLLMGGDPARAVRLSPAGARALAALQGGVAPLDGAAPVSAAAEALAVRLIDAGLAHPCPVPVAAADVTVVIPVRDRAADLERCLATVAGQGRRVIVVDDGSQDSRAVAAVCARAGAGLIRRPVPGGPGAARNAALPRLESELVAFLDSDCVPEPGWLELLAGVMADPRVGAVAPRIQPVEGEASGATAHAGRGVVARFAAVRSPLDLGDHPGEVRPGGRIAYVPTAALMVRRAALSAGFDPALRYGEDVDLVWRLFDAGWRIRYEPAAVVRHAEPSSWRALAGRRFRYGTAAGPLARRHPERLAPVVIHPRPGAVVALAAAGAPGAALAVGAAHVIGGVRRLRRVGVPASVATVIGLRGLADSAAAIGQAGTMLAPGLMAAGLAWRRTRPAALVLLLTPPLRAWARSSSGLDPLRFSALHLADDVAYGTGVWTGAIRARTWRPLRPSRARTERADAPASMEFANQTSLESAPHRSGSRPNH